MARVRQGKIFTSIFEPQMPAPSFVSARIYMYASLLLVLVLFVSFPSHCLKPGLAFCTAFSLEVRRRIPMGEVLLSSFGPEWRHKQPGPSERSPCLPPYIPGARSIRHTPSVE